MPALTLESLETVRELRHGGDRLTVLAAE